MGTFFFTPLFGRPLVTERNKHRWLDDWLLLYRLVVVVCILVVHRALEGQHDEMFSPKLCQLTAKGILSSSMVSLTPRALAMSGYPSLVSEIASLMADSDFMIIGCTCITILPLQTIKSVAMQYIDLSKQGCLFKDVRLDQGLGVQHQLFDSKVAQLLVSSGAVIHVGDQVMLTE